MGRRSLSEQSHTRDPVETEAPSVECLCDDQEGRVMGPRGQCPTNDADGDTQGQCALQAPSLKDRSTEPQDDRFGRDAGREPRAAKPEVMPLADDMQCEQLVVGGEGHAVEDRDDDQQGDAWRAQHLTD